MRLWHGIRIRIVMTFVLLGVPVWGWAQQCENVWEFRALAQQRDAVQTLTTNGRAVAKVPTAWVRKVLDIKQRIDRVSGIEPIFLLCADTEPNAFATYDQGQPIIALTLGMKTLLGEDWDAYAAVLGHENAHLTLGHHSETQTREMIIGLAQLLGSLALETFIQSSGGGAGWGSDLSALGGRLVSSAYSRDNETEADEAGIRYSMAAGFDPQGAIRLHQKLNARGSFLSSHPGSGERIADLQKLIAKLEREVPAR